MTVFLLILHGLLAVLLLGAITHQCIAAWAPFEQPKPTGFIASARRTRPRLYANAVVVLYMLTLLLGALIYPEFRVEVRSRFDLEVPAASGSFEIKEHFAAIGLGLLPAYWYSWRPGTRFPGTSRVLTALLTLIVWSGFLIGHVLNNLEGL